MFGYVTTNLKTISKEDKERYRAYYCGLCNTLYKNYGIKGQMALNYDITFLYIILSISLRGSNNSLKTRCLLHPVKAHSVIQNEFADYCSAMNILLFYSKFIDDWNDDRNIFALSEAKMYKKSYDKAYSQYPEKAKAIEESLQRLSGIERDNVLNPDIPSAEFGHLMGTLFSIGEEKDKLYAFGFTLGKFIYVMDACVDLKHDIKHEHYNPMIFTSSKDFEDILKLLMIDCKKALSDLKIQDTLVDNILSSGIWTRFYMRFFKEKKDV